LTPIENSALPTEVGLYYRDGEKWVAMPAELATIAHSGEFVSTMLTHGLSKIKWLGVLPGAHSAAQVPSSVELLLYRAEATSSNEYELVPFPNERRRFQFQEIRPIAALGGGGGTPGDPHAINFQCEQVTARTCKIKAQLTRGEFGLVAPGIPAGAKGNFIARVYTFAVQ